MPASEQSDAELLGQYVRDRSDNAFGELVRRHLDLVYSAALRQVEGDLHTAQDIAQTVFTELARQADRLTRHPTLAGWLYTTTRQVASHVRRSRQRREKREKEAVAMQDLNRDRDSEQWRLLRPLLDEAMHDLPEPDRLALLLRFFEGRELRRVGEVLGMSENAARMRVQRALEKLRDVLARKGVATTTASLAVLLTGNALTAAPAVLLASVTAASTAGSVGTASSLSGFTAVKTTILAMKIPLSYTAALVLASVPLILQQLQLRNSRADLSRLRDELSSLRSRPDGQKAANEFAADQLARLKRDEAELSRLRDEAQRLQSSLDGPRGEAWSKAAAALRAAETDHEQAAAETAAVELRERTINSMKHLGLAARIFATNNKDRFPRNFEEIKNELGPTYDAIQELERFEFYPQPRVISETEPMLFLFREKQPRQIPNGRWERTYALADGSVQNAESDTTDFSAWEQKAGGIASPEPPKPPGRAVPTEIK